MKKRSLKLIASATFVLLAAFATNSIAQSDDEYEVDTDSETVESPEGLFEGDDGWYKCECKHNEWYCMNCK